MTNNDQVRKMGNRLGEIAQLLETDRTALKAIVNGQERQELWIQDFKIIVINKQKNNKKEEILCQACYSVPEINTREYSSKNFFNRVFRIRTRHVPLYQVVDDDYFRNCFFKLEGKRVGRDEVDVAWGKEFSYRCWIKKNGRKVVIISGSDIRDFFTVSRRSGGEAMLKKVDAEVLRKYVEDSDNVLKGTYQTVKRVAGRRVVLTRHFVNRHRISRSKVEIILEEERMWVVHRDIADGYKYVLMQMNPMDIYLKESLGNVHNAILEVMKRYYERKGKLKYPTIRQLIRSKYTLDAGNGEMVSGSGKQILSAIQYHRANYAAVKRQMKRHKIRSLERELGTEAKV